MVFLAWQTKHIKISFQINGFIYDITQAPESEESAVIRTRRPARQAAINNKYIRTRVIHELSADDEEVVLATKSSKSRSKRPAADDPAVKLKKVKAVIASTESRKKKQVGSSAQARLQKKLGLTKRS